MPLKPTAEQAQAGGQAIVNCRVAAIEKAGGTFPKIARELCGIAFSDISDYLTVAEGGEIQAIPLENISPKKRKALKKIREKTVISESKDGEKIYKDSRVEFELYDKLDALKYLCRLRGDEVQKVDVMGGLVVYKPTEDEVLELREIAIERARKAIEALNE